MIIALLLAAAAAQPVPAAACTSKDADEILVCAERSQRYRIDPTVLEASRARNAEPVKPPATADVAPTMGCIGPSACKGDQIPLVRMGLVALQAAALAVEGEDWRAALRTREDEYRLYEAGKARSAKARRPKVSIILTK